VNAFNLVFTELWEYHNVTKRYCNSLISWN